MFPINLLLSFQLEDYKIDRFLRFAYTHFKFRFTGSKRQKLSRTGKAILLFILVNILFVGSLILLYFGTGFSLKLLLLLILLFVIYPCLLVLSSLIIAPFEQIIKRRIVNKAKERVRQCSQVKIIGITGSYGKTSVKEYLRTLLQDSFEIIAPIETHNTLLGMSNFILKELKPTTQIMIVEMGAYIPGDIIQLCKIAKPNFAVITGITAQHLERFKSLDNIISTKFEITQDLQKNDILFVDGENENIQAGLEKYCKKTDFSIVEIGKVQTECLPDFQGISFTYNNETYISKLLGKHNAKNLSLAVAIAIKLGVRLSDIKTRIEKIDFVPHRLELLLNKKTGVYVIDDSFNGNIEGVKTTINLLNSTKFNGKKIYLTPGLVELGKDSDSIHFQIGQWLADAVDLVLLIKTPGTCKIKEGLLSQGFDENNIIMFDDTTQAHNSVGTYAKRGDVIIFQNDLTDNYF